MKCITLFAALLTLSTILSGQDLQIAGLGGSVTVRRDGRSIPYIEAKNEADLYFVQGYVTASDRLWQMDLMRRLARGETAEIFGKSVLEEDKRWRRFGFAAVSEESLKYLSPELKATLDDYARGVNAYIASLDDKTLPVEFKILQYKPRPWTPSDTIVIGKILADALSSTWRLDLLKATLQTLPKDKFDDLANTQTEYDVIMFGKDTAKAKKATAVETKRFEISESLLAAVEKDEKARKHSLERVGLYAEDLAASNNWVISGNRTADGKALLANDPHLQATAPGIWYLSHLETPTMRVAGVTFPGVPGIILGHNDQIAWGATNVGPDVQDLYVETFDGAGKSKTASGWEPVKVRKEEIRVRANPLKTDTETIALDVEETRNGVVILEDGGKKYSLKWTALDARNNDLAAFFMLNQAKSWDEFNTALSTYRGSSQNFVFADVKGNIGWHIAGAIPLRKTGDGSLPYDGSTSDGDWTGFIPYAELPNLYNPPSGFIVTANQRIVGTDYKYPSLVREIAPPWRARRLFDLLNGETKATMDFVSKAQHDAFNIPLSNLAKEITKANAASLETLETIRSWDGRMTPDSKAALVVNEIRGCLASKIADENKPAPVIADYPAFIKACDTESTAALAKRYGADVAKWTWGSVSVARFPHPLAAAPLIGGQFATPTVGLDGSGQTPNVASYVSMRFIASPGNWDATRHVIPLGQSGDPRSPHFRDQFEAWRTGTPAVFPFSKDAIIKSAVSSTTFTP